MNNLPLEICFRVFSYLETRDLVCSGSSVCSLWNEIARNDFIWKPLVRRHFGFLNSARISRALSSGLSWAEVYRWCLQRKNLAILVLGAEGGGEKDERIDDVRKKIYSQEFGTVDMMNVRIGTPTLATLSNYNAVVFYSYHGFNQSALGDVLAAFVNNGGGVVLGTYSNCGRGNRLEGKWSEGCYDPLGLGSTSRVKKLALGKIADASHRLMKGVASFEGGVQSSHGDGMLHPEAKVIAEWANGRPLVTELTKFAGPVVGLNFYPPSSDVGDGGWNVSSGGATLLGNAVYHCCVARHL